ncbi:MAG: hypothetical protein QS721_09880 [Candidatus Endonucleobacter sp. (ex Gigantidas childressi)]|nr:hypothetical protein [Candidatus Endonucleobacter sp. (ex Gigantidas childressi)]
MPSEPINPNKLNHAQNYLHDKKTENNTSKKDTGTVSGRQVFPLPPGKYLPASSDDTISSCPLTERGVTSPVGDPNAFVEASKQAMGYNCMAYALAFMGCQPCELQGMFHLVYQPAVNQPFINLSAESQEANIGLWSQYQQQADLIQQYNQQILYGLLNTIELQKQQILHMAMANQLTPSIELMQMAMPSVVWPQPVYLPHLYDAMTPIPSNGQFCSQMFDRSSPPWTLTHPSTSMPEPQAFDATGFYVMPQFGAQFNGITNPLYEPWINHMDPWVQQLSQGGAVDPAAFFQHSQQSLVTPDILNASFGEPVGSMYGASSRHDDVSQHSSQFPNKSEKQHNNFELTVTPEENKNKLTKGDAAVKLKKAEELTTAATKRSQEIEQLKAEITAQLEIVAKAKTEAVSQPQTVVKSKKTAPPKAAAVQPEIIEQPEDKVESEKKLPQKTETVAKPQEMEKQKNNETVQPEMVKQQKPEEKPEKTVPPKAATAQQEIIEKTKAEVKSKKVVPPKITVKQSQTAKEQKIAVTEKPPEIKKPKLEKGLPSGHHNASNKEDGALAEKIDIQQNHSLSDASPDNNTHKSEKKLDISAEKIFVADDNSKEFDPAKMRAPRHKYKETEYEKRHKKKDSDSEHTLSSEKELDDQSLNAKKNKKHSSTDSGYKQSVYLGLEHQLEYSIPAINKEKWRSVAKDISRLLENDANHLSTGSEEGYYAKPLPVLLDVATELEGFASSPSFEINQDISVETEVDMSTEFRLERDFEEGFAAAASNVQAEANMVPDHLRVKSKTWHDFIEMGQDEIANFDEQVNNAEIRRENKLYDGFYSSWLEGAIRAGPSKDEYDLLVSGIAAKKYHEVFFPGTPLSGYKKDQECLLHDNTIAKENMHFDNIMKGFALIEDKESKKVYLCFDEKYCHENSTSQLRKPSNSHLNTASGLVPELSICKNNGGSDALVVKGESGYDFLNPDYNLPNDIKPRMMEYGAAAAKLLSANPGWNIQPYPYKQLDNEKLKLVSNLSDKDKCLSDMNFLSMEAVMKKDVKVIRDLANLTTELTKGIVKSCFPNDADLMENIEQLLDEGKMLQNFMWSSDENEEDKTYCQSLNDSSQTTGAALRQYQISRRLANGLLASLEYPGSLPSFKAYIKLICSMEDVNTDLNTEDYESFYADPQGNPSEGNPSARPQDSVPVITDYQSRGGIVVKPFGKYERTVVSVIYPEVLPSYLAQAWSDPLINFGSHRHKIVAIEDGNSGKEWLPMSYDPHTHSLKPLTRCEYEEFFKKRSRFEEYIKKTKNLKSKALVQNEKSSKKPRKVSTTATHDLFGSGGLNIMHWPGMRYCSLNSSRDSSEWSATLAEETELLNRYKNLTSAQRNIAFELTMASAGAKRQPGINPERIKECLGLAIYLTEIACQDAHCSDENAAKGLHHIRHLMHINSTRECRTDKIRGSSQNLLHRIVAFVKAYNNPKEGYHELQQKLSGDFDGDFLHTDTLEKETRQMQERSNTFIHSSMQYKELTHPFYCDGLDKIGGVKNIDIKQAMKFVSTLENNEDYLKATTLKGLQVAVGQLASYDTPHEFCGLRKNELAQWIGEYYLTNNKVQQITKIDSTDEKLSIDSLFQLDSQSMDKESEKLLLGDCKKDFKGISDLKLNRYDADALNMRVPLLTGALAVPFHSSDTVTFTSIESAKAIAGRVLSTAVVRPPSYTCMEGLAKLTETKAFHEQTTEVKLKAIQYTTAALLQDGCKVNNLMDFSMWEMLEYGKAAHPDELKRLQNHRDDLDARAKSCYEISSAVAIFKAKYGDELDVAQNAGDTAYQEVLQRIGENEDCKDFLAYMNKAIVGLDLKLENLCDKIQDVTEERCLKYTADLKWGDYRLYPDINYDKNGGKRARYKPTTEEGIKLGIQVRLPPKVQYVSRGDTIGYRLERLGAELNTTSRALKPVRATGFPSEKLHELFIAELETLRKKGTFLSLQGLQAAIIDITCESEGDCIRLSNGNKNDELKKLVSEKIQNQVNISVKEEKTHEVLRDAFLKDFSDEKIVECIKTLLPIRDQEECLKLSKIVSDNTDTEKSCEAEKRLNEIKKQNGINISSDNLEEQIAKLKKYTLQVIEKGPDVIASNYRELLRASSGSKDDQLKAMAMANVAFSFRKTPPEFPKAEQMAAIIAVINSDSSSVAIAAEPGSGKSIYIIPALMIIKQLRRKEKNFPIYVTNNDILLQQDIDNFKHWGRVFHIPILKLDSNYESNLMKYTVPCAIVFGTSETVMGDALRLDNMDVAERIGEDKGEYKARGRCPEDKVMQLQEEGFNRAVIIDEYDTVKDRDSSGAVIISNNSKRYADHCGELSYDAYFSVLRDMNYLANYQEFKNKVIVYLTNQKTNGSSTEAESELKRAKAMTDDDWKKRVDGLVNFVKCRTTKYKLNTTYVVGYEAHQTGSLSKKRVISISNPTQENIKKLQQEGNKVKIYPVNVTTLEIVQNASFSNNGSNYLSYLHGLPIAPPTVTETAATAQDFFETRFADDGVCTFTATYGSGEMRDELIPEGRTNICFKTPYKLNLTEYPAQLYDNKIDMYDSAVNLAYKYIEEGKDVIILSSKLDDTFALDTALNLYQNQEKGAVDAATIVTLANLEIQPDHEVFTSKVRDLNEPFGSSCQRKKGYIINSTDASARGFNYDACNAVLISIECPPGERADLQKKRRVARKGRPGTSHNLMTKDSLLDYNCGSESIDPCTGFYNKESQEKLKSQLASKDSSISEQANIRRKLYVVISSCEKVFQTYYQKLSVIKSHNAGRINGLNNLVGKVVTEVNDNHAIKAQDAWREWRDNFLYEGLREGKTQQEVDAFIKRKLIDEDSFSDFKDELPFYKDVSDADCTTQDDVAPKTLAFDSTDSVHKLWDMTRRWGHCLHERQIKVNDSLKQMYQRVGGAV